MQLRTFVITISCLLPHLLVGMSTPNTKELLQDMLSLLPKNKIDTPNTKKALKDMLSAFQENIDTPNDAGRTILQTAITTSKHPFIIQALLQASNKSINTQDGDGNTALHRCFYLPNIDSNEDVRQYASIIVAQLFLAGADPDIKNKKSISPRELADQKEFYSCFNAVMSTAIVSALSLSE